MRPPRMCLYVLFFFESPNQDEKHRIKSSSKLLSGLFDCNVKAHNLATCAERNQGVISSSTMTLAAVADHRMDENGKN
jgi:hypothetical protein